MNYLFQECEEKVTGFEIQEEYHAADLHKELVNLKKVLGDEKRRSNSDSNKLTELQALFANSMKSYNEAVEHAKQLGIGSSHVFTNPDFYICNCFFKKTSPKGFSASKCNKGNWIFSKP